MDAVLISPVEQIDAGVLLINNHSFVGMMS